MTDGHCISWIPSWLADEPLEELALRATHPDSPRFFCKRPHASAWADVATGLRAAQEKLARMPIASIIELLDHVAGQWERRDFPLRVSACDAVVKATGFSREAVEESFDVELRNYRASSLWRALYRELGDPRCLDRFVPDAQLEGAARAIGPRLTLTIFTGNVPGLPALAIVRALLVKSAVIAKVASGEPSFTRCFLQSIQEIAPELADAVLVTYWTRDDDRTLQTVLEETDAVVAYGSDEACARVRDMVPDDRLFVAHGHKLSLGVVSEDYLRHHGLAPVAQRVARDVSIFNQHACIAPQVYFVAGGASAQRDFAHAVADALEAYSARVPLGRLDPADAAAVQMQRASQAWLAAIDPASGAWASRTPEWTLALGRTFDSATGLGNRSLRLIAVDHPGDALAQLMPFRRYLQNVALGLAEHELAEMAERFAVLGASRICAPGRMSDPSMMWHHDGRLCIAEVLRFCDIEMHESSTVFGSSNMSSEGGGTP